MLKKKVRIGKLLLLLLATLLLSGCFYDSAIYKFIMEDDWEHTPIYLTNPGNDENYQIDIIRYSIPYGVNNRKTTKSEVTIRLEDNVTITGTFEDIMLSPEQLYHAVIEDGLISLYFEESSYQEDFEGVNYVLTINLNTQNASYSIQSKIIEEKDNFRKIKYYTYNDNEFKYYRLPEDNSNNFLIELTDKVYTPGDIYYLLSYEIGENILNYEDATFRISNRWGNSSAINNYLEAILQFKDGKEFNIILEWFDNRLEIKEIKERKVSE